MTPNQALVALLSSLSPPDAQNRLMRAADRELALAMMYMDDGDRGRLLSLLSAPKQRRVRDELALHRHLRISYAQYRAAADRIRSLLSGAGGDGLRSYLRPVRHR